jgi:uncharacterized protein YjiS (DUF1127 family)
METIMSMISNAAARQNSVGGSILGRLAVASKRLLTAFITRRAQKAAAVCLGSMSDRELEDIGLSRSQIDGAVRGEQACDHVFRRHY